MRKELWSLGGELTRSLAGVQSYFVHATQQRLLNGPAEILGTAFQVLALTFLQK